MKFSNGCWLNKDGITRFSPQEVYSSDKNEKVLTMYAPCNRINHRGATLGGPVITYKITSPLENVLRIRAYHYMGAQDMGPNFEVKDEEVNIITEETENLITVKSGNLSVNIDENGMIDFKATHFETNEEIEFTSEKSNSISEKMIRAGYKHIKENVKYMEG